MENNDIKITINLYDKLVDDTEVEKSKLPQKEREKAVLNVKQTLVELVDNILKKEDLTDNQRAELASLRATIVIRLQSF